jgi:hypothetical protein
MVEVPLEIEAALPRDYDGSAVLATSGVPRKVQLKAPRDALKISTAYRCDQLLADMVRGALRGSAVDVQRVQEAAYRFVRSVRERRQDGASLTVTTTGQGTIEVSEEAPPPRRTAPIITPPPGSIPVYRPAAAPVVTPAEVRRLAPAVPSPPPPLARRIAELEAAMEKLQPDPDLSLRVQHLEERVAKLTSQLVHFTAVAELAGPGIQPATPLQPQREPRSLRSTAVDAFAEGLRGELRGRTNAALERGKKDSQAADKAAALAAEAALLGAPPDGTAERLRETAAEGAARLTGLRRLLDELDLYAAAELPMADRLLVRLEDAGTMVDPAAALEPLAQAVVRGTGGSDSRERTAWLERAAALNGWQLLAPKAGEPFDEGLHKSVAGSGPQIEGVVCPGLRRADGSPLVRARVRTRPGAAEDGHAVRPPDQSAEAGPHPPPAPPDAFVDEDAKR